MTPPALFVVADRTTDDQVTDLLAMIFRAKLMSPADRKFKKPKPGKKKVVKWPKTLEHAEVRECRRAGGRKRGKPLLISLMNPFMALWLQSAYVSHCLQDVTLWFLQ